MKPIVFFLSLLSTLSVSATPITALINSSSISISGLGGYSYSDGRESASYNHKSTATSQAPFQAYLSDSVSLNPIPGNPAYLRLESTAFQNSRVDGGHIEARGWADSSASLEPNFAGLQFYNSASANATFDLTFQIFAPTVYHLVGMLDGDRSADTSRISLGLLGVLPLVIYELGSPSGLHRDFDLTGLLAPGTYRLIAQAAVNSAGHRFEGETGEARFNFTADFAPVAVPETLSTAWLLAPLALMFLRRPSHFRSGCTLRGPGR